MTAAYLAGVRVVELADEQGEGCGRLLASLGADVIKVEQPTGSPTRRIGPFVDDEVDPEQSLYFWHYNLGKRSVVLDLDDDGGRAAFRALVDTADVFVDSCPRGVLDAQGLGYDELSSRNAALVHVSITPFGQTGPWADHLGSDLVHLALGGQMMYCGYSPAVDGEYDTPPIAGQMWHAFQMAGDHAAIGVLAALLRRRATGSGERIDIAIHQVVSTNTELDVPYWIYNRRPMSRTTTALSRTKDGRFLYPLYQFPPDGFARMVGLLDEYGLAGDLADEHYADPAHLAQRDVGTHVQGLIDRFVGSFTFEGPWREAQARGILWAPMRKPEENLDDPGFADRETFLAVDHPELGRSLRYPVGRWYSPDASWTAERRAPRLGEHSEQVLDELRARVGVAARSDVDRADGATRLERAPGRAPEPPEHREFPLEGVRVLDGTWLLASGGGPRYLAALGAEVIRFEWKGSFDYLRFMAPVVSGSPSPNRGGYFNDINAGRRGISLNMHDERGKQLFRRLLAVSDVFTEGYTATTMHRWGLPFDEMTKINPRLVYCQQPGFGFFGGYRDYRVVGPIANAISGLTEMNGLPEPWPPAGWGYSYTDWTGAYNMALAILVGLHHRDRTERGIWIDSSQVESGIAYTGTAILDAQVNGRASTRTGNGSPNKPAAPHGAYRCRGRDRWLAIAVLSDDEWNRFCEVLGRPPWTNDQRFASMRGRLEHTQDLDRHVEEWTVRHDAFEAMTMLQASGVRAGVCQTAEDRVDADPQLAHLGWLVDLPQTDIGTWPVKDTPITFSNTRVDQGGTIGRGAPNYGEDNEYVFSEILGLTASEITELEADGVI